MELKNVEGAPDAIGPYSHAVRMGRQVFCSGQTPLDPATMTLKGRTVEEQTATVLDNLTIVLSGFALTLQDVVKTTVYLTTMAHFPGMNAVYARMFGDHRPARTTVAVRQLPLDALVEIECIARIGENRRDAGLPSATSAPTKEGEAP